MSSRKSLGSYADLAALREEIRKRLERNALDRARHVFADRIIEFAVANATLELPDLLIEREQEVMLDELKVRLAEQGIGYEDYLRATERDEPKIVEEFKPDAERRVKTLLVLSEIAEKEGVKVTDDELEVDLVRSRERYADNPAPGFLPRIGSRPGIHAFPAAAVENGGNACRSLDRATSGVRERATSARRRLSGHEGHTHEEGSL